MRYERLAGIYGERGAKAQAARYEDLIARHRAIYGDRGELTFVSAPGRAEIAGNHTDHNRGRVLASAVDLDIVAVVSPNDRKAVTLHSVGYRRPFVVDLNELAPRPAERESSAALIRGVAARMEALGHPVGGFDAVADSAVYKGSGLSSSAAFEVMVCAAFDALYCGFALDRKLRAKIARYAENEYFGKPCGLMDQMASSVGGLVGIDFRREDPDVEALTYDFAAKGLTPVVVSAGGEHGNLTAEYASMPEEMRAVAARFGESALREVDPAELVAAIPRLKGKVSDRAILRALHFIDEDARVPELIGALKRDDVGAFLKGIVASGESSWKLLQNIYTRGGDNQEIALALELSRRILEGRGAWRVHGGGFAGTILAFVPDDALPRYAKAISDVFGPSSVTRLTLRPVGAEAFPA